MYKTSREINLYTPYYLAAELVNYMSNETILHPVLPLRDIVVFPTMVVPLFVGREKSVKALEVVMAEDKEILLSSQIVLYRYVFL